MGIWNKKQKPTTDYEKKQKPTTAFQKKQKPSTDWQKLVSWFARGWFSYRWFVGEMEADYSLQNKSDTDWSKT